MTLDLQRRKTQRREFHLERKRLGLCNLCDDFPIAGKVLCEPCAWRQRIYKLRSSGLGEPELEKARQAVKNFTGVCDACGRTGECGDWCMDHDHVTLRFRGIIGRLCNVSMGVIGDNPEILARLSRYLCRIG